MPELLMEGGMGMSITPLPGQVRLPDVIEVFRRWLHLPDVGALEAVLAALVANRLPGDPVWLMLVGPPGGGKSELLSAAVGLHDVHPVATVTEAALLSGTPKREVTAGSKGGLLRVIGDYGIILCKDFGSVLSMNRDARASVMAALREVYDGSWTRHLGADGGRSLHWEGKVGMIVGCTPTIDSHHSVMGSMGERFVLYRFETADGDKQVDRALDHVGHEHEMRAELGAAVERFIGGLYLPSSLPKLAPAEADRLKALATLAVRCRSAVERDNYHRDIELIPEPEAPGRLALVLARLLGALDLMGVEHDESWRVVAKVALDSMPALRRAVLHELLGSTGERSTTSIGASINYPTQTTRRALEDLQAHGVLSKTAGGEGRADMWAVSAWARRRWETTFPETLAVGQ